MTAGMGFWCCGGPEDSRMALQISGVQLVPSVTFWRRVALM
jgi:hypothetical protein